MNIPRYITAGAEKYTDAPKARMRVTRVGFIEEYGSQVAQR